MQKIIRPIRCAVYTRKSTDENLDSDFNSLDAQREAGEAYVASQRQEGWVLLPDGMTTADSPAAASSGRRCSAS